MAVICATTVESSLFNYRNGSFSAEASCLGKRNLAALIYDDAADVGFLMKSARTGKKVAFSLSKIVKDNDGDIQCWEYVSQYVNGRTFKAVIFND